MDNRDLDIGYVIEKTFSVIRDRIGELIILALILVGLPNIVLNWLSAQMVEQAISSGSMFSAFSPSYLIVSVLIGLLPLLLQAAVIHTTVESMSARPSDFGSSIAVALGAFLPLIVLTILLSIAYTIGFALLVVPGLILMTLWAVAIPCLVIEKAGIFGSLSRSFDLTEGQRWRIFALMVLAFIGMIVLGAIIAMLTFAGGTAAMSNPGNIGNFAIFSALINAAVAMLSGIIGAVGVSVLYVHLRDLKEGTQIETIGDVFQ